MAYRADIEIGVRGTEKLRELRSTLDALTQKVSRLDDLANVFNAPIQSLNNYNRSLETAVETLRKVELGTQDEADAVKIYVRALGEANTAQDRQNRLIQQTIKLLEEEERVRRLTAAGIFETTRFSQPIGPARPSGVVPAGGFPVAGPAQSPGFQRTQKDIGRMGENLALGAGFPLLFGGGPGTIAGSILGSFAGTGFGGQILGGAIGQVLDAAIQKTAQLGTAMQTLDLTKIEQSGIRINANLATQISLMQQVGNAAGAQALVQDRILRATGAMPGTVEGISDAVNLLSASWGEFTAALGVTLGIIGAPFAAALGGILQVVNLVVKGFNVAISALGQAIKVTGEWVVKLVGGEDALTAINNYLKLNNQEIEKARGAYAPILADLNGQILLTRDILDLEKQKTTNNKLRNAEIGYEQQLLRVNAEIDQQIRDEKAKQTTATKALVEENIRQLNVVREQRKEEAQLSYDLERRRIIEQQAAERARQAEQAQRSQLSAAKAIFDEQLKLVDINIREQEIIGGQEAGLRRSLQLSEARARITEQILSIERNLALQEARKNGTTQQTLKLYDLKIKNAQYLLNIEDATREQRIAQAQVDQFVQIQTAVQASVKPLQDLKREQELQEASAQRYYQLLSQGILPAEAKRLADFDATAAQQQYILSTQISIVEATLAEAINRGATADFIDKQVKALEALKAAQQGVTNAAASGPGKAAAKPTAAQTIQDAYGKAAEKLQELTNVGNIVANSANMIGEAFGQAFQDIVTGSSSAQEALGNMMKSIGENFVNMAAQIIAQQMTMIILGAVMKALGLGLNGGNTGGNYAIPDSGKYVSSFGKPGSFGIPSPFAEGGFVTGPTNAIIGEGGESEYVIPASKMQAAMSRYATGARGASVIPGSGSTDSDATAGGMASQSTGVIDVRYSVERINSVDYVTTSEFQAGIQRAAQQGAQQGEQRTLRRLQQSRSTRSRLGML